MFSHDKFVNSSMRLKSKKLTEVTDISVGNYKNGNEVVNVSLTLRKLDENEDSTWFRIDMSKSQALNIAKRLTEAANSNIL